MKTAFYILALLSLPLTMQSCYGDKGNYEYGDISSVKVELTQTNFDVVSFKDNLVIEPMISVENGSEENLEYIWAVSKSYTKNDVNLYGLVVKTDTISHDRNLNYAVDLEPGEYFLYYSVCDTKTGIKSFQQANLFVTNIFSRGFYILKEINGNTDVDLHYWEQNTPQSSLDPPVENLLASFHGAPMPGKPESFGITYQYGYYADDGTYIVAQTLNIGAGRDLAIYITSTWNLLFRHNDGSMFWHGEIIDEQPLLLRGQRYGICYFSDKGLYFSKQAPGINTFGAGKFGYLMLDIREGTTPNPNFLLMGVQMNYIDEKGNRMISVDRDGNSRLFSETGPNGEAKTYSPNDMPHKLIYYGGNTIGKSTQQYMIFEDRADPSQRYLYILDINDYNNPITDVLTLDRSSLLNNADLYSCSERQGLVMYFVHDNSFYMYQVSDKEVVPVELEGIGSGEQIVYITNKWFNLSGAESEAFDYVAVATSSGSRYKIYLYETVGPKPIGSPAYVFEGEGTVFAMHYISNKMNNINTHNNYSWGF